MSGTVSTMRAAVIIAPCSPCMNWLHDHAAWWCVKESRSFSFILSQTDVPRNGLYSSGIPTGLAQSTSIDQSMRLVESHCLSLPFWYRDRSRSRGSSYSQLTRAEQFAGTSHVPVTSVGTTYFSAVLMT